MRLIDADALMKQYCEWNCPGPGTCSMRGCGVADMILKQPTISSEKRGWWIYTGAYYTCSECGGVEWAEYPFCHMCGAKMGRKDEANETD